MLRGTIKGLDIILDEEEDQEHDGEYTHETNEKIKRTTGNKDSMCFFRKSGLINNDDDKESKKAQSMISL